MHMRLICLLLLALSIQGSLFAESQTTGSVNISHPLVTSVGYGRVNTPWIIDGEIGLGGAKAGIGFAMLKFDNGGKGGGIAVKVVVMRTWKSPVDSFWKDTSFYEENYFVPDRWYGGVEGVISPLPYRLALGAYKLMGSVDDLDDTAKDFDIKSDDILWGASLGMGF